MIWQGMASCFTRLDSESVFLLEKTVRVNETKTVGVDTEDGPFL
jgi:hypothetical protein